MSGHVLPFEGRSHRDVERLLPWYANATLAPAERDLVYAHLSECAQCRTELAVLRGGEKTIAAMKPWIIVEVNRGTSRNASVRPEDILDLLSAHGYRFFRIDRRRPLTAITKETLGRFENVLAQPPGRSVPILS